MRGYGAVFLKARKFVSEGRQMLDYELPLAEIIYDFYDKLKSITRGYGTMDYEIIEFRSLTNWSK